MSIINHLTDTDLYKLTMMQGVLHIHPAAVARYRFKCRNGTGLASSDTEDSHGYLSKIKNEIDHLCSLEYTEEELSYLSEFSFFKPDFIDFLKRFRLDKSHIRAWYDHDGLQIDIQGPCWHKQCLSGDEDGNQVHRYNGP